MWKIVPVAMLLVCLVVGGHQAIAAEDVSAAATEASPMQSAEKSKTQDEGKTGSVEAKQMEELVVTATRVPTPVKELPVPVQVIGRKEIEQSYSNDLSDLLIEKLPEHFQKYTGALTAISIRGLRSDTTGTDIKGHVLLLIDGHRAGTGNIAAIPLENVERVEIVKGPGSVVYGSAAMGGVVNVITRKGKGDVSGEAGVEYGSWNDLKGRAGVSGGLLNDKVGFSLTGRSISQGTYSAGNGKAVENTGYNDEAYSLSLRAAPNPNHSFFAVGNYFHAWDVGTPNPSYAAPDLLDSKNILRGYGSIDYDGCAPDWGVDWRISYYNVLDRNEWEYPLASYGYSSATTEAKTQGTRTQVGIPTTSLGRLLLGFDWDRISVDSFTSPGGSAWSPDSRYDNFAVFAEEKVKWRDLTFLAGVRYDIFDESITPSEGFQTLSKSQEFSHASWRTGMTYNPWDWLTGRFSVGTGFRAPAADELAGRYSHGTYLKIVGNPDLKPETSTTYDVGAEVAVKGFKGALDFFYTDFNDRISGGFPVCVNGDCTWTTYKNVGGAVYSGIEGSLSYKMSFTVSDWPFSVKPFVDVVYYTQRELKDPSYQSVLQSDTIPYVPLWDLTGGLEIGIGRKVTLLLTGFYTGDEEQQDWNYSSPTYTRAIEKNGFAVFSTRLSVRPVNHYNLFLAVENIGDNNYAFVDGYLMPGRTFRAGIEARF